SNHKIYLIYSYDVLRLYCSFLVVESLLDVDFFFIWSCVSLIQFYINLITRHVLCVFHSYFFFSSRRRHTRSKRDWSSDVCSSDLVGDTPLCTERRKSANARSCGTPPPSAAPNAEFCGLVNGER